MKSQLSKFNDLEIKEAGTETPFTLKHLRKTYLTWVFHTIRSDTKLLSSHTSMKVLENHYINPLLLNVEEEKLMKVKVFGQSYFI